jgi:outer membrane lipoprotein SlyB
MRHISLRSVLMVSASLLLFGCQNAGEDMKGNVYKMGQGNVGHEAKVINILALAPAQLEADNSQQKKGAEVLGGLLGAVGGGVAGNKLAGNGNRTGGTIIGAAGGGAGGALLGSMVSDKTLVDGVSITFTYEATDKTDNAGQVGKLCEYKLGKAILVVTGPNQYRIQPNSTCPPDAAN